MAGSPLPAGAWLTVVVKAGWNQEVGGTEASGSGGRISMRYLGIVAAIAVCLALAGPAPAVSYTVYGWGPTSFPGPVTPPAGSPWGPDGYPGDTVELVTYTGTLVLADGASYVQKINTLQWTVDYTYAGTETQWDFPDHWTNHLLFPFSTPRSMTVGTATGSLSQAGLLDVNWNNDDLSFAIGSTTSFIVVDSGYMYRVDVMPLGLGPTTNVFPPGGNPWVQTDRDVMARFDVTLVPEPVTMAGLMMGIGGLVTYVRKRRTA